MRRMNDTVIKKPLKPYFRGLDEWLVPAGYSVGLE